MKQMTSLKSDAVLLFKSDLRQQHRELTRAIDKIEREIRTLPDYERADVIDDASGNSSVDALFTTNSYHHIRLRRVEAALDRIVTGDFGICAGCGKPISLKRLRALPWANTCIDCQQEWESGRTRE